MAIYTVFRTPPTPAGGGDAIPVPEAERVLGLLRSRRGDAELFGLGSGPERALGEDACAADARPEPELQPYAQTCVQGRGNDCDRSGWGRAFVPSLRAAPGWGHEAEPGEADHRASDRLNHAGIVADGRGVRPDQTGSDGVERAGNDECGVEAGAHKDGPDEPEANRLQGRASIEMLGWALGPESPRIGYAPLESRTKRWATESQIEGWFPPPGGERHGCEGLPDCDTEPPSAPLCPLCHRSGNPNHTDAGGQKRSRLRVVGVCFARQPHRRRPQN